MLERPLHLLITSDDLSDFVHRTEFGRNRLRTCPASHQTFGNPLRASVDIPITVKLPVSDVDPYLGAWALGDPQKLTTSARIDLTRSQTDHAAWQANGRDLHHPCRRRVYSCIGLGTDVLPARPDRAPQAMLVGEAAPSGPVGGKVSASRASQFFASAEGLGPLCRRQCRLPEFHSCPSRRSDGCERYP